MACSFKVLQMGSVYKKLGVLQFLAVVFFCGLAEFSSTYALDQKLGFPVPAETDRRSTLNNVFYLGVDRLYSPRDLEAVPVDAIVMWTRYLPKVIPKTKPPVTVNVAGTLLALSDSKLSRILQDLLFEPLGEELLARLATKPQRLARMMFMLRESPYAIKGAEGYAAVNILARLITRERVQIVEDGLSETEEVIDMNSFDRVLEEISRTDPNYAKNIRRRAEIQLKDRQAHRLTHKWENIPLRTKEQMPAGEVVDSLAGGTKGDVLTTISDRSIFVTNFGVRKSIAIQSQRTDSVLVTIYDPRSSRASATVFDAGFELEDSLDRALQPFRASNHFHQLVVTVVTGAYKHNDALFKETLDRLFLEGLRPKAVRLEGGLRAHSILFNPKSGSLFEDVSQAREFTEGFVIPEESYVSGYRGVPQYDAASDHQFDESEFTLVYPAGFEALDINSNNKIEVSDLSQGPSTLVRSLLDRDSWDQRETKILADLLIRLDAFRVARVFLGEFENEKLKETYLTALYQKSPKKFLKMIQRIQEGHGARSKNEGVNAYNILRFIHPENAEELLEELKADARYAAYAENIRLQIEGKGEAKTESSLEPEILSENFRTPREKNLEMANRPRFSLSAGEIALKALAADPKRRMGQPDPVEFKLHESKDSVAIVIRDSNQASVAVLLVDSGTNFNDVFDTLFYRLDRSKFSYARGRAEIIGGGKESLSLVAAVQRRLKDQGFREILADYGNLEVDEEVSLLFDFNTSKVLEHIEKSTNRSATRAPRNLEVLKASEHLNFESRNRVARSFSGICSAVAKKLGIKKRPSRTRNLTY